MILAAALIVGQALVILLLLRFVRTFGRYTDQLVEIHNTMIQVQERQEALKADLDQRLKEAT